MENNYIGRFAPTPSGPLHFGSIVAALGSYLDALHHGGQWLVRIDDIDLPRVQEGATDIILSGLETLGLHWDGELVYQSRRLKAYEEALHALGQAELLYHCYCPRKLTKGKPYPGTCRDKTGGLDTRYSVRLKTNEQLVIAKDRLQQDLSQEIQQDIGDFIVKRSDKLIAYHLAVVVDDAWQNITHIVRGTDLWDSTPRQIYLQRLLGLHTPDYCHLPVAINEHGRKISKTNHAQNALLHRNPQQLLVDALGFLGQNPEPSLVEANIEDIIQWGIANWELDNVPRQAEIRYDETQ